MMVIPGKSYLGMKVAFNRCEKTCGACRWVASLLVGKPYRIERAEIGVHVGERDPNGWLFIRNEKKVITRYSAKHFEVVG